MFERYSWAAKRSIFFARYEAATSKSEGIDTKHLLLGILREGYVRVSAVQSRSAELRRALGASSQRDYLSAQRTIPLTLGMKRALVYGAEEATRLSHYYIEPEHLLAGLLRESEAGPADVLKGTEVNLDLVRTSLSAMRPASLGSEALRRAKDEAPWLLIVMAVALLFAAVWFLDVLRH